MNMYLCTVSIFADACRVYTHKYKQKYRPMNKLTPSFSACAALILLGVGVTPLANTAYTSRSPRARTSE